MELYLYNTLSKKKEKFEPLAKASKEIGVYGCGPTVYSYQHIGNLYRYLFEDYLIRVLEFNGFKVKHLINVTDVGHLTSDEDSGEDKIEKASKSEGKTAKEIAEFYFKIFENDLKKLNVKMPNLWTWATDHIKEQIEIVKTLEKKGFTYRTSDGIYFDTSKVESYGELGNTNVKGIQAGKRVNLGEKKNNTDFALWKFSEKIGERQQEWNPKDFGFDAPVGFPGWHIECSAMSSKYLGKQFEIHTGGQDHIQIHHTNEIAQSECAFGVKPWVKYWLHCAWLKYNGEKMSKSKGGIAVLSDLEKKGINPLEYRYFCLTTHYKKGLDFSFERLKASSKAYRRLINKIKEIKNKEKGKVSESYIKNFNLAINDDLNLPKALQVLELLLKDESILNEDKIETIKEMDSVFGLDLLKEEEIEIPKEILEISQKRQKAREEKNWEISDKLRDELKEKGWNILDTKEGFNLEKI